MSDPRPEPPVCRHPSALPSASTPPGPSRVPPGRSHGRRRGVRLIGCGAAALALAVTTAGLTGCAATEPGTADATGRATTTTSRTGWPTPQGRLSDTESRTVFERAAAALARQKTMLVNFGYERTDGFCVPQVLNPAIRLDARDPAAPVASLGLSILASNVAVGGKVYRQQPDPTGSSTVWVVSPEARSALEFVLWKPGAAGSAVAYLGTERVADATTRHYRVFDPSTYAGPTAAAPTTGPSATSSDPGPAPGTPCRTPTAATPGSGTSSGSPTPSGTAGSAGTPSAAGTPSGAGAPSGAGTPSGGAAGGVGDYDDFWLADDGTPQRIVSVLGGLKLTSNAIAYGKDVRVDVPDVRTAITEEEYAKRSSAPPSPTQ